MTAIPSSITELSQWTSCYPNSKRPIIDPNKAAEGQDFEDIEKDKCYYGFLLSPNDPFVIIDIDNDKVNPVPIEDLLASTPQWIQDLASKSYTEVSPSGKGLHIVAKVPEGSKAGLSRAYFKARDFVGQVSVQNAFMTFTGNPFNSNNGDIAEIEMSDLEPYFKITTAPIQEANVNFDRVSVPDIQKIENYLDHIPINQSPKIKHAYAEITGQDYCHYDFWIMVGMSLHDYGTITGELPQCYHLFLKWSQKDQEAYQSEQNVQEHWRSFSNKPSKISYKTLLKFAAKFEFDWPYPVVNAKGVKTGGPIPGEYKNFEYLMNYYNLQIVRDRSSGGLFISGQEDICDKYFLTPTMEKFFGKFYGPYHMEALASAFLLLCQDNRYRSTSLSLVHDLLKVTLNTATIEVDMMSTWLDTPFEELPEDLQIGAEYTDNSTMDYIMDCIEVSPTMKKCKHTLVKSIIKKWFMGIIKLREPISQPFDQNGGMLFFIGPENSRKTTFFNMILPKPLTRIGFIKTVNTNLRGDKDQRDFLRSLGSKVLIVLDEYDGLNENFIDAQLKNLITTNDVTFTDIYKTSDRRCMRSAMLCATSNSYKQRLSRNGTRRMWCVQVQWIDTSKLLKFNWHHFYRTLREEFRELVSRGRTPWLLTPTEIDVLNSYNLGVAAKTDLSIMLEAAFDFESEFPGFDKITSIQRDKTGMLMRLTDILTVIKFKFPNSGIIKMSALENELSRCCGIWTGTHNQIKQLISPKAIVHSGKITQGKYTYWVLPATKEVETE
jgi:hypothetical protein